MAKCNRCGSSIKERVTTRKASYHYEISGLDNIYLADVTLCRPGRRLKAQGCLMLAPASWAIAASVV